MRNSRPDQRSPRRAQRRGGLLTMIVAFMFLGAGALVLVGLAVAPQAVERACGQTKTSLKRAANDVREQAFGDLPTVQLGTTGGVSELDRCDGTFTEMSSYEREGVPPVWAAHNNCSGDAVLPWEIGQHVQIDGDEQLYEVVDIRHTPKAWVTTDDLIGLGGDFALQTCFYGENQMKFVGLRPAG